MAQTIPRLQQSPRTARCATQIRSAFLNWCCIPRVMIGSLYLRQVKPSAIQVLDFVMEVARLFPPAQQRALRRLRQQAHLQARRLQPVVSLLSPASVQQTASSLAQWQIRTLMSPAPLQIMVHPTCCELTARLLCGAICALMFRMWSVE